MYSKEMIKRISIIVLFCSLSYYTYSQSKNHIRNVDYMHYIFNEDISYERHLSYSNLIFQPRIFAAKNIFSNNDLLYYGVHFKTTSNNKINFYCSYDIAEKNDLSYIINIKDSLAIIPSFGLEKNRLTYNLEWNINKIFTTQLGLGNQFIGEGYHSLFLSSKNSPYNFLKIKTDLGRIKYYNLYSEIFDARNIFDLKKKFLAIHYLSFKFNKFFDFGVFESVVWQADNLSYNRGFDISYLNPIIFYRPVEFSKNSPDNVMMGLASNIHIKNFHIYNQLLIDDLNISRQKDADSEYEGGFFQNKFAYQIGIKKNNKKNNILLEYNHIQPYTYAHKEPMQSYTHLNQSLAHPFGANLKEFVFLFRYKFKEPYLDFKLTSTRIGLDSADTHYGQNIFLSDFLAQGDNSLYSYGNYNGQGVFTTVNTLNIEFVYPIKYFDFFINSYYHYQSSDIKTSEFPYLFIGIRNFPLSTFSLTN